MQLYKKITKIAGCFELFPKIIKDERGYFIKTFHHDIFVENGLETNFKEDYHSFSVKGTLRGLHFQQPPMEHVKLVYCVSGTVLDVAVDLRVGSATYGAFEMFTLSAEKANMVYIPKGLAHGFFVLSEHAVMMYKLSTVYAPELDSGILWDSLEIPWPEKNPIISARDCNFIDFEHFHSPFVY